MADENWEDVYKSMSVDPSQHEETDRQRLDYSSEIANHIINNKMEGQKHKSRNELVAAYRTVQELEEEFDKRDGNYLMVEVTAEGLYPVMLIGDSKIKVDSDYSPDKDIPVAKDPIELIQESEYSNVLVGRNYEEEDLAYLDLSDLEENWDIASFENSDIRFLAPGISEELYDRARKTIQDNF